MAPEIGPKGFGTFEKQTPVSFLLVFSCRPQKLISGEFAERLFLDNHDTRGNR